MDPRENDRRTSEQEQRPDPEERGATRTAQPGASTPLDSDQIVDTAPAKREQRDRRAAEQEAEGGGLASGIGDDRK